MAHGYWLLESPQGFADGVWRKDVDVVFWVVLIDGKSTVLAIDDFGIKFFTADNATHLLDSLQKNYFITVDPSSSKYCGLTID